MTDSPLRPKLVYLAGFLDGEGSVMVGRTTVRGYTSYRPRVEVTNSFRPVIDHVGLTLAEFGVVSTKTIRQSVKRKERWTVSLCSWEACGAACKELLPYLIVKRQQAETLIEWVDYRLPLLAEKPYQTGFSEREVVGTTHYVGLTDVDRCPHESA